MPRYVVGFVLPVPKKSRAAYTKMARLGRKVFLEYGAIEYRECVADDVKPGKLTSFPQSVKLKKNEEVWFSWVVFKSRRDSDRIMKQVMADPRMASLDPTGVMDGKRMFWGGFKEVVSN
jgi:uncharacterized protein YbaA (DUF1428 family)